MKCAGETYECQGVPIYFAQIEEGPGLCFHGTTWCEDCMGESFREGNPYLKKIANKPLKE